MRNPPWHRDELILTLDLYFDKDRGSIDNRNPKVIDLSVLLNKLPIFEVKPNPEKFRNPNGVSLKLSNFQAIDPDHEGKGMNSYSRLDKAVFEEFNEDRVRLHHLACEIKKLVADPALSLAVAKIENDESGEVDSVKEGQILYRLHKVRERDKKIAEAKKKKVLRETGALKCEACGFDFEEKYGEMGKGFIECHHLVPLAEFEVNKETKLEDLALLCSNCHRMVHRDMGVRSVEEFKRKWGK